MVKKLGKVIMRNFFLLMTNTIVIYIINCGFISLKPLIPFLIAFLNEELRIGCSPLVRYFVVFLVYFSVNLIFLTVYDFLKKHSRKVNDFLGLEKLKRKVQTLKSFKKIIVKFGIVLFFSSVYILGLMIFLRKDYKGLSSKYYLLIFVLGNAWAAFVFFSINLEKILVIFRSLLCF